MTDRPRPRHATIAPMMTRPRATDASGLHLAYLLARHPQANTTFVNGEIAALANEVARLSIYAMSRTGESDPGPGGIPASVAVNWAPGWRETAFWARCVSALRNGPTLMGEVALLFRGSGSPRQFARVAYTAAQAATMLRCFAGGLPNQHIHAHFAGRAAIAAHVINQLSGTPYTMTVHAYDVFMRNPQLAALVRGALLTVAISEASRREVLARVPRLDPASIKVIRVGVPTAELGRLRAPRERRNGDPLRIVSAGNLVAKKGMDRTIDAVARLRAAGRDVELEIIGEGPLRANLDRQVRELGAGSFVRTVGSKPPTATRTAIANADMFVLACQRADDGDVDGIPVVLMEAMAAGVPTVSTRISGIPELIEDRHSGRLAEPGDPASLASVIAAVADDSDAAERMALAGREKVRNEFDQATNAHRLLDAILEARSARAI